MTADDVREEIARALANALSAEGGGPGNSIHGWRCEHPDRYGPCDCVAETGLIQADAILPILARREQEAYQRGQAEAQRETERLKTELDDRFAGSDHKAAIWYRRWREATR